MTKSSTTPIVMLTLQDLRDVIREEMGSSVNVTHESETPSDVTTKYHITIQKTITQIKAIKKGVSESRPCFEKFTMP